MNYLWTPWRMAYVSGAGGGGEDARPDPQIDNPPPTDPPSKAPTSSPTAHHRLLATDHPSCIFCDRARLPESRDRESLIVLRVTHNFVILNLYPYNTAHLMIVPYTHVADLPSLDSETAEEMMALAQKMVRVIGEEYRPDGFNLGMNLGRVAGAGVADHLHLHIVPRWAGDTNFMPIVGATKVMPELPETTLDRLQRSLRNPTS